MDEVSTATIRHRGRCVVSIVRQIDESCLTQTVAAKQAEHDCACARRSSVPTRHSRLGTCRSALSAFSKA